MSKLKLTMRPSEFTKAFIPIEGQPFYFKDPKKNHNWREYLLPIYDNLYKECVLKTGRQVEKSTTQANRHITYSALIPFFRSIYVSPTGKQTKRFSNDRLRKSIQTSDFIQKYFIDNSTTDQVFEKTLINRATIFLGYCYLTADSLRGLSADMLNIDEYQDIVSDNIPVLRETLAASDYKLFMATGTPKTYDNHLEQMWQESTRNIWLIPCKNCGVHNRLDKDPEAMIKEHGLVCKKCGTIVSPKDGFWYSLSPDSRIAGFHISQLQTGRLMKKENWLDFYHNKYLKYSKKELYNEVFGLSYDDADKPITISDLKECAKGEWIEKMDNSVTKRANLYMGVDWGEEKGSWNVAVVGGFVDNTFQIFYIRKFTRKESRNPDLVIKELKDIFYRFGCKVMGCDHGAGHKENLRLQEKIGFKRVWEIYHSANKKKMWDWKENELMYVTSRTKVMQNVIYPIQEGKMILPKWEYMSKTTEEDRKLYEDFTSLNKEYSERLRRIKYDHDGPDDIMQATVYCKFVTHVNEDRPFK